MAYNTRPLKRAQDGVAPQYYNRTADEYEVLEGTAGANHVVIYGPDGQPASLATEAKLEAVRALLALLEGKDFATDTKAEAIRLLLASLDGKNFASETTLAAMETKLGLVKAELEAVKTMLTDGTAKGEATLSGKKESLIKGTHDSSASVAVGGSEEISIEPNPGTFAEVVWFRFGLSAPPGGASGTHRVEIGITAASSHYVMLSKSVAYNQPIVITLPDLLAISGSLTAWTFSPADPLIVRYTNSTDVAQTNTRFIRTRRLERSVF